MSVVVRAAQLGDAEAIVSILRTAAEEGRQVPARPYEIAPVPVQVQALARAEADGLVWLVAERDGAVVGFLTLRRGRGQGGWHVAELGVTVTAELRGQGIGTAMMRAAEDAARPRGMRKLILGVLADNDRARQLYERLGYEVEGRLRRQWLMPHGFVDEILMAKWLE